MSRLSLLVALLLLSSNLSIHAQENAAQLQIDPAIKLTIKPSTAGLIVDRITEATTVFVSGKKIKTAYIYAEPVDAPYGGKSLAEPKLIGKSSDARHNFPVRWNTVENYPYFKIFALCQKDGNELSRSHAMDIGIGGKRLQNKALETDPQK
ncbi:MAG: hypothetical protein K2W82_16545 [Candidatus Obscuribacterales bacterium]|nr:hypothetical protein [Candidatus Obscuribacterales bacterium]